MFARLGRALLWLAVLAFALWWGRLVAHSKQPPPEGHWRELPDEVLA